MRGGAGDRGACTLELLGTGTGGVAEGNHSSLLRSMAPLQEDEDLILGDTYYDETCRQQGRQVTNHTGNKAVEERRRAVVSRK